jgi:hypothetical protein
MNVFDINPAAHYIGSNQNPCTFRAVSLQNLFTLRLFEIRGNGFYREPLFFQIPVVNSLTAFFVEQKIKYADVIGILGNQMTDQPVFFADCK